MEGDARDFLGYTVVITLDDLEITFHHQMKSIF
jgi:hypothetical protein